VIAANDLEVLRPRSVRDALTMLRDEGPLTPLAGGTDLFVALNAGLRPGARYLDLWGLDGLRGIEKEGKGRAARLVFGALTTYTDCIRSRAVARHLPILALAARQVGGVQIQNRGTLAGNIGNGSPAGDSLPVLMAADAIVTLASRADGERDVPLAEYYTGYRASVRRPDELIVRLRVDAPSKKEPQAFRKVGTRAAQAISKVVMARVGDRVALGSVAPTVVRLRKVEAYLAGGGKDPAELRRLVAEEVQPIDDVRSTATYRLRVAQNLVASLVD
jgi:CO/xanthine dehydrogenase FAD-binding subunit